MKNVDKCYRCGYIPEYYPINESNRICNDCNLEKTLDDDINWPKKNFQGKKMRNRAKCKLCGSIIESFHANDYVACKCGEIYVDAGDSLHCGANLWCNFLRVDDEGNEIIVTVQDDTNLSQKNNDTKLSQKPNKKDLLDMLEEMIKNIESLPSQAMTLPVNHYDFCSLLILLSSILRTED